MRYIASFISNQTLLKKPLYTIQQLRSLCYIVIDTHLIQKLLTNHQLSVFDMVYQA